MVVTSGLPLLMVKGKFTSLETMSIEDLETFVPFMSQCSVQRASAATINNTPVWWLNSIEFKFPLKKPAALSLIGYRRHLVSIVCRCYYYHDQQYIIQFCSQLTKSPDSVIMRANNDNTTSLYYTKSHLHILTFNNENQEYDRVRVVVKKEPPKSPRRCLMPSRPSKRITDVYLCENCDAEFNSQAKIAAHERQCYGLDLPPPEPEPTPSDLLGYLQLGADPPPPCQPRPLKLSLIKNKQVEFSSLLGRRILGSGKAKVVTRPEKLIQQYESYCFVSPRISKSRESYEFRGTYKSLQSRDKHDGYARPYCFSRAERLERYLTLRTGLNWQSRALKSKCKSCRVCVTRIKPEVKTSTTTQRLPGTSLPLIVDLCSSDDD